MMHDEREGVDTRSRSCVNTRNFAKGYSATGAPSRHRASRRSHMLLTAEDIAARTGTPLRTVQERFRRARRNGAPVVRVPRGGRGQPPWGMTAEDYARRIGVDLDALTQET